MKFLANMVLYFILPFLMGSLVNLFFGYAESFKIFIWNEVVFELRNKPDVEKFRHAQEIITQITRRDLPLSMRDQALIDDQIKFADSLARDYYFVALRYVIDLNCNEFVYSNNLDPARGRTFALIGGSMGDLWSKRELIECLGKG